MTSRSYDFGYSGVVPLNMKCKSKNKLRGFLKLGN